MPRIMVSYLPNSLLIVAENVKSWKPFLFVSIIDILYTLDSASNYSAMQKLKPWLQTQDIPMKWEDSNVFYLLNRELKLIKH
jgi:hypothetical protein